VIPKPDYLGYSVSKGGMLGARVLSAMFTPMTCRRVQSSGRSDAARQDDICSSSPTS